jgi:hypothetical protein
VRARSPPPPVRISSKTHTDGMLFISRMVRPRFWIRSLDCSYHSALSSSKVRSFWFHWTITKEGRPRPRPRPLPPSSLLLAFTSTRSNPWVTSEIPIVTLIKTDKMNNVTRKDDMFYSSRHVASWSIWGGGDFPTWNRGHIIWYHDTISIYIHRGK